MTKLLEEALVEVRTLPEDEQDRVAEMLFAFTRERDEYTFTAEQIDGVHHAVVQADAGEFASDTEVREIFGRTL